MNNDTQNLRATDAPTKATGDYLLKRRTSEGPRRRNLKQLSQLLDVDLDDRNARVWRAVSRSCLAQAGLSPLDSFDPNARDAESARAHAALCAAAQICNTDYEIPIARLAELAKISPQAMGRRVRKDTSGLVTQWRETHGDIGCDTVVIEVTKEAAQALTRAADVAGESPITVASAAILAVC